MSVIIFQKQQIGIIKVYSIFLSMLLRYYCKMFFQIFELIFESERLVADMPKILLCNNILQQQVTYFK